VVMLSWLLTAQHVARPMEIQLIVKEMNWALFLAAALWCFYMGIEPYVRRHWPDSLISWTRLLQGRLRNPLVASHVLAGVTLAAVYRAGLLAFQNLTSAVSFWPRSEFLGGGSFAAGSLIFYAWPFSLFMTMATLLLLVLARLVSRRIWIGDMVFVLLFSAARFQAGYPYLHQIVILSAWETLTVLVTLWMFRRCGLLSFAVFSSMCYIMAFSPVDWSSWYLGRALVVQLIPLAIAAWALWIVLSAQRIVSGWESVA